MFYEISHCLLFHSIWLELSTYNNDDGGCDDNHDDDDESNDDDDDGDDDFNEDSRQ